MADNYDLGPKERLHAAIIRIVTLGFIALMIYWSRSILTSKIAFVVMAFAAIVGAQILFVAGIFVYDFCNRGANTRRALRRIQKGAVHERMQGVQTMEFIGSSAAFYISREQKEKSSGPIIGSLAIWQEQRLLDKYVFPALRAAMEDSDAHVRALAAQALENIGTWEAIAILKRLSG